MKAKPKRILLESSYALATELNTGVQRVVRNVIREAVALERELGVRCVSAVFCDGKFYDARTNPNEMRWHERLSARLQATVRWIDQRIQSGLAALSPRAVDFYGACLVRLRKALYPRTLARAFSRILRKKTQKAIQFEEGDVLLLLDSSWWLPIWPTVEEAKPQGCVVGTVVYDLIPVRHPEFCVEGLEALFRQWIEEALRHSDFFLTISETVREDVVRYARSLCASEAVDRGLVESFRLGADFLSNACEGRVRSELRYLFPEARQVASYLVVGTIEPRKNHTYLLDAFDIVWQTHPSAKLCLVGAVGAKGDEILARIRNHPRFAESLFIFHDLNDAELSWCYQRAKALLFASLAEGFGLPIVEALHHGLRVMAGNTRVNREVGRDHCAYFDLDRPQSAADMIMHLEQRNEFAPVRARARPVALSWHQSCRELLTKSLRLARLASRERRDSTADARQEQRAA